MGKYKIDKLYTKDMELDYLVDSLEEMVKRASEIFDTMEVFSILKKSIIGEHFTNAYEDKDHKLEYYKIRLNAVDNKVSVQKECTSNVNSNLDIHGDERITKDSVDSLAEEIADYLDIKFSTKSDMCYHGLGIKVEYETLGGAMTGILTITSYIRPVSYLRLRHEMVGLAHDIEEVEKILVAMMKREAKSRGLLVDGKLKARTPIRNISNDFRTAD